MFNYDPPQHHHSTPIAARPIQALEKVVSHDGGKVWATVDGEEMMRMLADAMNASVAQTKLATRQEDIDVNEKSQSVSSKQQVKPHNRKDESEDKVEDESKKEDKEERQDKIKKGDDEEERQDEGKKDEERQDEIKKGDDEEERLEDESTREKISDQSQNTSTDVIEFIQEPNNASSEADTAHPAPNYQSISRFAQSMLGLISRRQVSNLLENASWIYVLDSGGQPQFFDVSRAFLRGCTINVILFKLTERLSDKPSFTYSIHGKKVSQPSELQLNNVQIIESLIRSIVSAKQVIKVGNEVLPIFPLFLIVGTHYDKTGGMRKLFQETLAQKNSQLAEVLAKFKKHIIYYDEIKEQIIFPVNNMAIENRKQLSDQIQQHITAQKKAQLKYKLPIRWYMFEAHIKDEGSKEEHGVVTMARCVEIGADLGMDEEEVHQCAMYLQYLTTFLYFPKAIPHLLFTNPQYLLDMVSTLISVSFVEYSHTLKEGYSLPPDAHRRLRQEGVFDREMLECINFDYVYGIFMEEHFLALLAHLCIASPVLHDSYFMPCVLPATHLSEEDKAKFCKTCDPLLVLFKSGVIPQVYMHFIFCAILIIY